MAVSTRASLWIRFAALFSAMAGVSVAGAALAVVPEKINYQGLLLDDQGQPVQGSADFVFTLYDALTGGSPLWTESHPAVPVQDGVYDVALGSTTPLGASVIAGGVVFLEIAVDGETLVPRQQLVSVPFALRSAVTDNVGAAPSAFVTELFQNYSFDGADPPNDDPSEGFDDPDGDGLVNFLDADNDQDGLGDAQEVAGGTHLNLVTPTITGFAPDPAETSVSATVSVSGTNFEAAQSVAFGTETPTPQNVTPTSFDVVVGPQPVGTVNVVVTRANGEDASASFDFAEHQPVIASLSALDAPASSAVTVTVTGSGFKPGLSVSFGSESPVPQNLTPTSFQVTVGPQTPAQVTVTASYPSGNQATALFAFTAVPPRIVFVTSLNFDANLGGLTGADAECNTLASAASLPGSYLAWLGDGTNDPWTRFPKHFPYQRVDGQLVATSFLDLRNNGPNVWINLDENGVARAGTVWTGVGANGQSTGKDCSDWTATTTPPTATVGTVGLTSPLFGVQGCDPPPDRALYCFQQ